MRVIISCSLRGDFIKLCHFLQLPNTLLSCGDKTSERADALLPPSSSTVISCSSLLFVCMLNDLVFGAKILQQYHNFSTRPFVCVCECVFCSAVA